MLFVRNLSKAFGAITVLEDISFVINAGDRVGIVGSNGVGKTTLLSILVGQESIDAGSFSFAPSTEIGYLPQTTPEFYGRTMQDLILESLGNLRQLEERMRALESAMSAAPGERLAALMEEYDLVSTRFQDRGGYDIDHQIDAILDGLRISYIARDREMQTLSGGEKARVGLATLLLRSPDLLLLDEPTNHLDVASLEWLESYLSHYKGAALLVSHDRQFLNRAVNQIFEIDEHNHHLKKYEGNYDAYVLAKAAERAKWEEEYERQQEEIKELRKRIRETGRNVAHNRAPRDGDKMAYDFFGGRVQNTISRNVRAAEEQLRRIEEDPVAKPPSLMQVNAFFNTQPLQSESVINVSHITKCWGAQCVLRDASISVSSRARILLFAPNGAGKTTLLKLIMGLEQPDGGSINIVESARIGYLPQDPQLDMKKTVIDSYRYGQVGYEGEFIGRLIGYGLFRLEDMHKKVGQLSLGQRRKLEIARLMAAGPNALLLDEPTNYISLDVLEAFESAMLDFPGPIIAVSHDRWFIQRFAGTLWTLADGKIVQE
ncbi:MAG TPA: ABC-F family ATP-binding cassette domain-containing protein [Ktedonobacteraceae bacterium]|nr:ABC-F family ATP-binding cassette domain-containing protein [Ktedonobacteraceae bacterium]